MSTLTGREPKDTYKDLLKVENAQGGLDTTHVTVETGNGDQSTLQLSTESVKINGVIYPISDGTAGQAIVTDGAGTASFATVSVSTEDIQDIVGAMFSDNTETGVTVTYQDADGTIDVEVGIGSSVQAYSANLDSWSAVAPSSYLTTASAASTYLTIATASSTYQPLDGELTALAGLTSAANKGIMFTGAGTASTYDLTAAGLAILDDANAAAQLTTLGAAASATTITVAGTANEITSSAGAQDLSANRTWTLSLPSDIDLSGKTTFKVPVSAAPTISANGHLALDTTVTDFSHGILKYYGGEELGVLAMPIAQFSSPTNGYVPTYNSTTDEFELAAASAVVADGDKGDISISGGVWSIDAGVVTYAKIQDVSATDKVLGRSTAGAGAVEEIACTAAGRALLDDADASAQRTTLGLGTIATQAADNVSISGGSITGITDLTVADGGTGVSSNTAYAVLCGGTTGTGAIQSIAGVGTSGQVLTSNGAGALPTFQAAASSAWTAVTSTTASSSASIIFTGLTTYNEYMFVLSAIDPVTDGAIFRMEVSVDNGATYLTGAITYEGSAGGPRANVLICTAAQGNAAGEELTGNVILNRATTANALNYGEVRSISKNIGGTNQARFTGYLVENSSDVDAVRFTYDSSNINAGTIYVFGR